jgi:hypothetical protein
MIDRFNSSKYSAKNECNTMIIASRRCKDPSSGVNRPADITEIVNINAEFNMSLS